MSGNATDGVALGLGWWVDYRVGFGRLGVGFFALAAPDGAGVTVFELRVGWDMGFFSSLADLNKSPASEAKEAAQQMAIDLKVFEAVTAVVDYMGVARQEDADFFMTAEWEKAQLNCTCTLKQIKKGWPGMNPEVAIVKMRGLNHKTLASHLAETQNYLDLRAVSIIAPDGSLLYASDRDGQSVSAFRFGPWVDRLKAYADSLVQKQQEAADAKKQAKLEKDLKPFSPVDF